MRILGNEVYGPVPLVYKGPQCSGSLQHEDRLMARGQERQGAGPKDLFELSAQGQDEQAGALQAVRIHAQRGSRSFYKMGAAGIGRTVC